MKQFTDSKARVWAIEINVATLKRVLSLVDVDLTKIVTEKPGDDPAVQHESLIGRLSFDEVFLCDVLCAICRPQMQAANVTDEQFAEGMGGDGLLNGQAALFAELIAFFRSRGKEAAAKLIQKEQAFGELLLSRAESTIEKLDPVAAAAAVIESRTSPKSTSGSSSIGAPESLQSTRDLSGSAT